MSDAIADLIDDCATDMFSVSRLARHGIMSAEQALHACARLHEHAVQALAAKIAEVQSHPIIPGMEKSEVNLNKAEHVCDELCALGHTGLGGAVQEAIASVEQMWPHSRACGPMCKGHGPSCHNNCPTCHGNPDRSTWTTPPAVYDLPK